mmetsp:Transcript_27626/g.87889  ORF Transcript_27626/g.87889 Transcript_27626/m.87889 type:complete len:221 (+) Transcript_27626:308-970(+)
MAKAEAAAALFPPLPPPPATPSPGLCSSSPPSLVRMWRKTAGRSSTRLRSESSASPQCRCACSSAAAAASRTEGWPSSSSFAVGSTRGFRGSPGAPAAWAPSVRARTSRVDSRTRQFRWSKPGRSCSSASAGSTDNVLAATARSIARSRTPVLASPRRSTSGAHTPLRYGANSSPSRSTSVPSSSSAPCTTFGLASARAGCSASTSAGAASASSEPCSCT